MIHLKAIIIAISSFVSTAQKEPPIISGTCSQFLLLTRQRSGSTWLSQVLNSQPGVSVGRKNKLKYSTELVAQYSKSYPNRNVKWGEWSGIVVNRFNNLRAQNCGGAHTTVGFKLMYDQIPQHLSSEFIAWVAGHNISVVHLVREATILSIASHVQTSHMQLSDGTRSEFFRDPEFVAKIQQPPKMHWNNAADLAAMVKRIEKSHEWWRMRLKLHPRIRYHYVAYEQLLILGASEDIKDIVRFLGPAPAIDPFSLVTDGFLRLHESRCDERIGRFHELKSYLNGTHTEVACAMLAGNPIVEWAPTERPGHEKCALCGYGIGSGQGRE